MKILRNQFALSWRSLVALSLLFLFHSLPAISSEQAGAIITDLTGFVKIDTQGQSTPAKVLDIVKVNSSISATSGSEFFLFLPDSSLVSYKGPVMVTVKRDRNQIVSVSNQPGAESIRGLLPNQDLASNQIHNDRMNAETALKLRVLSTPRYRIVQGAPERELLSPRGLILSQRPSFRIINTSDSSYTITLSPSSASGEGMIVDIPVEKTVPFPVKMSSLERGRSYVVPDITSASFTIASTRTSNTVNKSLIAISSTLPPNAAVAAQASALLRLGLPCDALDLIYQAEETNGSSRLYLDLRRKAYREILGPSHPMISALFAEVETSDTHTQDQKRAETLLDNLPVPSTKGGFEFCVGTYTSQGFIVPVAPGDKVNSGDTLCFAIRMRSDAMVAIYNLDAEGQFYPLPGYEPREAFIGNVLFLSNSNWILGGTPGLESFLAITLPDVSTHPVNLADLEKKEVLAFSKTLREKGEVNLHDKWTGPLNKESLNVLSLSARDWAIIRIIHSGPGTSHKVEF